MARDATASGGSAPPPAAFVEFVARRLPGLRRAAHTLSGNDRLADSVADELLITVAARWQWLDFTERRMGRRHAADAYLDRIFAREAADWTSGRHPGGPPTGETLPAGAAADLAGYYWHRGGRARRRRRLAAAGIAAVLLAAVCAAPRGGGSSVEEQPPALPIQLPPLVDVLPAFEDQARLPRRETALPVDVALDPAQADGWLAAGQVRRALAVFLPSASPPMVLGDDGSVHQVRLGELAEMDLATRSGPSALTSSSLSPDGTRVALLGTNSVIVLDVVTAKITRFGARDAITAVVWLTPGTLLMAGASRAYVLDPRTGYTQTTSVDARHVLTVQGRGVPAPPPGRVPPSPAAATTSPPPAGPTPGGSGQATPGARTDSGLPATLEEQVVELLPIGEPVTAPARIRRYVRVAEAVASPVVAALSGEAIGWLGPWLAPGFITGGPTGYAARDCDTAELALPERYGEARLATVVVRPSTGRIERTLVAPEEASTLRSAMLLGFLDSQTALVRTSDGRFQHLLAWRITDGNLRMVATVNRDATVSVADIAAAPPR